jgi:hypothetical protein
LSDAFYFSRRLLPDETAIWTGLLPPDEPPDDPHLTQSYMNLDDSMFFASFLGDETVGISTIYRDRVRMSILLSSLRVLEEYRERITKHIIKTSLPFFKTAAIREAEAVVNLTSSAEGIPFPLVTEIGPWALGALTENGFRKAGDYVRTRFRVPKPKLDYNDSWDKQESTSENLRELFWNTDEKERPDHARLWLGFALGGERGIYTSSIDNNTSFAMSFQPAHQILVVTSLLYDSKSVSHEGAAARVIDLARMKRYDQVVFPLLSNTSPVIDELRNMCGSPVSEIPLELLRKPL